mgnify:FL=1
MGYNKQKHSHRYNCWRIDSFGAIAINTLAVEARATCSSDGGWSGACTIFCTLLLLTAASFITFARVASAFISTALAFCSLHFGSSLGCWVKVLRFVVWVFYYCYMGWWEYIGVAGALKHHQSIAQSWVTIW